MSDEVFINRRAMQILEETTAFLPASACSVCGHDPACGDSLVTFEANGKTHKLRACHADSHSCFLELQEVAQRWMHSEFDKLLEP
jgi:hypothetical protein